MSIDQKKYQTFSHKTFKTGEINKLEFYCLQVPSINPKPN